MAAHADRPAPARADTFRDMATYPQLAPLRDLRHALGELRLEKLAVGPDGRNRVLLFPFGARTGRNTPSNQSSSSGRRCGCAG